MKNNNTGSRSALAFPALLAFMLIPGLQQSANAQLVNNKDTLILDRVVAVVGKFPILQSDVENQYRSYREQDVPMTDDPKCFVLESLLVSKLLLVQAEIDSVEVTDEDAQRTLDQKLEQFIIRAGSQEALEKQFSKSLLEIKQDFLKDQKNIMIAEKMRGTITQKVTITPSEVQKFYKQIPNAEIPLRPAAMEVREIVLKPDISEKEIARVTDRLKEFRERIQKGESFATLAVLYSEDEASAPHGGALGMTPRSQLVPEFAAVAFNLKGDEVSRVVKTDYGYHIMQLVERRGDMINVRHILLSPKPSIEEKMLVSKRLDSIVQVIRQNKIKFEDAALKYSTSKDTRANGGLMMNMGTPQNPYSDNVNTTWFEPQEMSPQMLNAIKDLKVGEISRTIETQDNDNHLVYKVFTIKTNKPAHKADLKQDYQYLQALALRDKQDKVLKEWIANKQKALYIQINPDYRGCNFQHKGWIK